MPGKPISITSFIYFVLIVIFLELNLSSCAGVRPPSRKVFLLKPTFLAYHGELLREYSEKSLFEKANILYSRNEFSKAARLYTDIISVSTNFPLIRTAMYNLALCYINLDRINDAILILRDLVDLCFPDICEDARELFASAYLEQRQWREAEKILEPVDEARLEPSLFVQHQLNLSRIALVRGHTVEARMKLQKVLRFLHTQRVADADYYRGLTYHLIGESYFLDFSKNATFPISLSHESLENLAKLILLAQKYYLKSFAGGYNIATRALYKLGTMYREMYTLMLNSPLPEGLSQEEKEVYLEELKKEISPLLHKAALAYQKNLELYARFGIENRWVRETTQTLKNLNSMLSPGG